MPSLVSGFAEDTVLVAALSRVVEKPMAYTFVASDGVSERIYYFAIGGIRVIRSGPRKGAMIGEMLVEAGKLAPEDLGRALAASKQNGTLLGETCVALGMLKPSDVDAALRAKVAEETLDLFLWDGAEVHLHEGQPPKDFYEDRFEAAQVTCDVAAFLRGVLDRVEDWRGVLGRLPTGREVYEAAPEARAEIAVGPKARLFQLFDGSRTASDAMTRAGMRRVAAFELILDWLRQGKMKRVAGNTAQRISRDELVREIEALEEALKVNADAAIVRGRLARALEAAGENPRASAQWRLLADRWRRENDLDRALECCRNCVRATPTDFATRELILEIHRHRRDYGQLVGDGRPLAELFVKHNLLNRAKHLLIQLVGIEGEDAGLRRQLVMVLIGLGERELALKHLRELARLLEKRKASAAELRDAYVQILALDKNDRAARDRLDVVTGAKFQRRVLMGTLAATAAALALLGAWFVYEGAARRGVGTAIETARAQFAARDYDGAKATLAASLRSYAHARAAAAAASMIQRIEEYEERERVRLAKKAAASPGAAANDAEFAKRLAARAKELADAGRDEEAHRAYRELFDLYPDTPAAADVLLPLKVTALPLDAHVELSGEDVGQGAVVVKYSPREKRTLVVRREGYVTFKRVLDGPQDAAIEVALERPTRWTYSSDAAIDAAPLVENGTVFVAGRDRCLTAVAAEDGAVRWRTALGFYGDASTRPVAVAEGVFVATCSGDAACVSPVTGDVLWRKSVGAPVERQPVSTPPDAVVVSAEDGSLHALSAADGSEKWTRPPGSSACAAAAIENRRIAYVDAKGALVVASADTGEPAREAAADTPLSGAPVVEDGRMWARTRSDGFSVISESSCREVKRFSAPASGLPPTVVGDTGLSTSADGFVYGFRPTGDPWFRAKIGDAATCAPAFSKGRLYVPAAKNRMYCVDATSGAVVWRFDAKSPITATPTIEGGTIYVPTAAGKLYAIEE